MFAILSLLLIVTLSILVTRVATIALSHTGLSRESARFQARSAFTGAGFTTHESENVVAHPVRRRIVALLMLLGNAGFVTAITSLLLTFVGDDQASLPLKVALLAVGLTLLWLAAQSSWVDRRLSRFIDRMLRRYTTLDVRDYANLMHLGGDYRLVELEVRGGDWIAEKTLRESRLRDEGVVVLGVRRGDDTYLGAPDAETKIVVGDTIVAYGRTEVLEDVDRRGRGRGGDVQHARAVQEHEEKKAEEQRVDPV